MKYKIAKRKRYLDDSNCWALWRRYDEKDTWWKVGVVDQFSEAVNLMDRVAKTDFRCFYCNYNKDSINHELGCKYGNQAN
jgi:hypothetical protein